jgi:Amt family ammonium transporter
MRVKNNQLKYAAIALLSMVFMTQQSWAETAPYMTDMSTISAGNTAWMLTSTALVLLMTIPGIALFYAGMVRKKNVLATSCKV